nr:DIE2/ALG10 family [Tanacetum cinerariifolium]
MIAITSGSQRSKEDEVHKISTSVFVTNFPDQSCVKDLWNACKQYGYVVDVFIPNRTSKAGKGFGFVRFIKFFDVERLVSNLCTVWVGRHRIHANVARFQRATVNNSRCSQVNREAESNPVLVLDESCVNKHDYSYCLNGKVKDFGVVSDLKVVLGNEGFDNIVLRYLGGLWVMIEFTSVEVKEKFQSNVGTESIELFNIKRCWGNFAFDYVHSASVGNFGGILCVWDTNSFMKVNATVSDYFVMVRAITLDKYLSDHRPIILRESTYDYGPITFHFFIIGSKWMVLRNLKMRRELEKLRSMEAAQKAKIKWAIEGDENSKYYHGILNKKRNQLSIRGVLAAGSWIENPVLVKN